MRGKLLENVIMLTKMILPQFVKPGFKCIDATTGNGNDIEYLLSLVGESGYVYGFDIQKIAIENTRKRLEAYKNFELFHMGHEKMLDHIKEPIDFIVFNLGYLPSADKTIRTKESTTLRAIEASLSILKCHGILCIVVYPGHKEGQEESVVLEKYLETLDQKKYTVMKSNFINQVNNPPYLLAIEKKV